MCNYTINASNKSVDWSKPLQFRNLKNSKIIRIDKNPNGTVYVTYTNSLGFHCSVTVNSNGLFSHKEDNIFDVINVPEKTKVICWITYYPNLGNIFGYVYSTEAEAKRFSEPGAVIIQMEKEIELPS